MLFYYFSLTIRNNLRDRSIAFKRDGEESPNIGTLHNVCEVERVVANGDLMYMILFYPTYDERIDKQFFCLENILCILRDSVIHLNDV